MSAIEKLIGENISETKTTHPTDTSSGPPHTPIHECGWSGFGSLMGFVQAPGCGVGVLAGLGRR